MIEIDSLLGREFVHGTVDCYSLVRDFYKLAFDLELRDYARPDNWWEPDAEGRHLNLYMDNFANEGFGVVHSRPSEWLPGDLILMAIRSTVANHAAVLMPGEQILHHLVGQRSVLERYNRPLFRDTTMAVLRHPKVDGAALQMEREIDAWDLVPRRVREQIETHRRNDGDV